MTEDGRFVLQLNRDGQFFVSRLSDGELLLKGAYVDDEVIVLTPDGRYDTSYEGAEALQVSFAGVVGLQRIHQFEAALSGPGSPPTFSPANRSPHVRTPSVLRRRSNSSSTRSPVGASGTAGSRRWAAGDWTSSTFTSMADSSMRSLSSDQTADRRPSKSQIPAARAGSPPWYSTSDKLASRPMGVVVTRASASAGNLARGGGWNRRLPRCPPWSVSILHRSMRASSGRLWMRNMGQVFAAVSTKTLIDEEATKNAILTAVHETAETTGPRTRQCSSLPGMASI